MTNRLYFETYTKENVEALKKVESELDQGITSSRNAIQQLEKSLNMYESLGGDLPKLLKEYRQLTSEIENTKWAHSQLDINS